MPTAPSLPTTIVAGVTAGHPADSAVVNGVVNKIYLANIGATRKEKLQPATAAAQLSALGR